jgi:hypothetical protein
VRLSATLFSWGRMVTRLAALAKCSAALVLSAEPVVGGWGGVGVWGR